MNTPSEDMNTPREDTLPQAGVKLLVAGVAASFAVGLILIGIVWGAAGSGKGLAAGIGAAMGLLAMGLSQAVLTLTWRMRGVQSLAVAIVAYAVGVAGVIIGMVLIDSETSLDSFWAAIGVVVTACAYIIGVVLTYPRLRILVYSDDDEE